MLSGCSFFLLSISYIVNTIKSYRLVLEFLQTGSAAICLRKADLTHLSPFKHLLQHLPRNLRIYFPIWAIPHHHTQQEINLA